MIYLAIDINKVRWGLKNLYYAPYIEGVSGALGTWGSWVPIPAAVSFDPTAQGTKTEFYADNMQYFTYTQSNGEAGDIVVARFPTSFLTHALGWIIDENGMLVKMANVPQGRFALAFEMQGDKGPIRRVLYNCVGAPPSSGSSTTEDSIEISTETMEITATNIEDADGHVFSGGTMERSPQNSAIFDRFFEEVLMPEFKAA